MEIVGWILAIIGIIIAAGCGIWLLVVAFKESVMWGVGSIVCNIVSLIFVITHWDDAKRPFLGQLAGLGLIFLAGLAGGPDWLSRSDSNDDSEIVQTSDASEDEAEEKPTASAPSEPTNSPPVATVPTPVRTNLARLTAPTLSTQRVARPVQPRRPPPEPAASAEAPSPPKPAVPPKPEPESLLLPGHQLAVEVEVVSTGEPNASGLRQLNLRMTNHTRKTAKQVRMTIFYLGNKKEILKQWATSVYDPKPSLTSNATIEIMQPAFGIPEFTANTVVRVDTVRFEDGTEWQR